MQGITNEFEYENIPLIGEPAPEFGANTTHGYIHFPNDYRGRWVVFFSHPGDFTPVCTTEFMTFQSMADEFHALNTELIGLSVDSNASHLAWIQTIRNDINYQGWKNMEIGFPVIADTSGDIARMYGMLHPGAGDTDTVRAVFIIDPRGTIRTILYYPKSVGRNITEIKRIVIALQTSDAFHVATPAEWIPGEDVIVPAPTTTSGIKRGGEHDWFLRFKSISPEMILNKITNRKLIDQDKKTGKHRKK